MAMQVISPLYLQLVGDGVSTTFVIPPAGYTTGTSIITSLRPTRAALIITPFPGNAVIDSCGNIVITFKAPWGLGFASQVQIDLYYASPLTTTDNQVTNAVYQFAATTGIAFFTNPTPALIPLLSIQPQAGATSTVFTLKNVDVFGNGQLYHYQLLLDATLVGANFVDVDPASFMTYDLSATSYSGGRLLDAGDVGMVRSRNDQEFTFSFSGSPPTPSTITLVFAPVGRCAAAGGTLLWDEHGGGGCL